MVGSTSEDVDATLCEGGLASGRDLKLRTRGPLRLRDRAFLVKPSARTITLQNPRTLPPPRGLQSRNPSLRTLLLWRHAHCTRVRRGTLGALPYRFPFFLRTRSRMMVGVDLTVVQRGAAEVFLSVYAGANSVTIARTHHGKLRFHPILPTADQRRTPSNRGRRRPGLFDHGTSRTDYSAARRRTDMRN